MKILSVKRFFINDHGNPIAAIIVNLNFFSYKLAFCELTVGITIENSISLDLHLYPLIHCQLKLN